MRLTRSHKFHRPTILARLISSVNNINSNHTININFDTPSSHTTTSSTISSTSTIPTTNTNTTKCTDRNNSNNKSIMVSSTTTNSSTKNNPPLDTSFSRRDSNGGQVNNVIARCRHSSWVLHIIIIIITADSKWSRKATAAISS